MALSDKDKDDSGDWQFAAMVVDRLCLVLMTFCTGSSVFYVLWAAPYLYA
jgi:nicotinic acetylcholine receptor